jgi:N-acetylglucosamine-6-phosphate deacetylase
MTLLSGATIVQPAGLLSPATLAIDGDRIAAITAGTASASNALDLHDHYVVPGFIDVHVHGVAGVDALDGGDALARIARRLPQHGVTAFCPTSIACSPAALRTLLDAVREARQATSNTHARVLAAHLESNFISAEFKGAQPEACLRVPGASSTEGDYTGQDILDEIDRARADVGIITIAPEIDGVLELIPRLVRNGHIVSLGHSGATYEQGREAIEAGARQATHLFNRMSGFTHRSPGLTGAVLDSDEVAAEVICDGVHVHPAAIRLAVAAKSPSRVMAITDGTAGAGLPRGSRTKLGGRNITVGEAARLDDGTLAGSVLTMDLAFARLVTLMGFSLVDAALMCATTPAREMSLHGAGMLVPGALADLVVLDRNLRVVRTYVAGTCVFSLDARATEVGG